MMMATVALAGCLPGLGHRFTGAYVATGPNLAVFVQIVQTANNQISGRFEEVDLKPDGQLSDLNAALSGVVDGDTVSLTVTPSQFLSGSFPMSGATQGSGLHLTGGGNGASITLDLARSDEASFRAAVAELSARGGETIAAKARQEADRQQVQAEAQRTNELENLIRRMNDFTRDGDAKLPKFGPAEAKLRSFTERMRRGLAKERSILGSDQAEVARSQISVAIAQVAIEADQFHDTIQTVRQNMGGVADRLIRDGDGARQACAVAANGSSVAGRGATCAELIQADKRFRESVANLHAAFIHIEGVWAVERGQQVELEKAADAASR